MATSELKKGTLVRYDANGSRWHLGRVRRVEDKMVHVDFFWRECGAVPRGQVTDLRDFLADRNRSLSVKRSTLCDAFFGEPLLRLTTKRAQSMQRTLRKHGFAYEPSEWPSPDDRITIWADSSIVRDRPRVVDRSLQELLPQWLDSRQLLPSSRDPLGLQAYAETLANQFLPGLTVFTNRAGYYGFLLWAIQTVNERPCPPGQTRLARLHKLERAFALTEFIWHGEDDNSCPIVGQRSKRQVLSSAVGNTFGVPARILKNQGSGGAYRLYYSSLISMCLAEDRHELAADGHLPLQATDLGRSVARAFANRLPPGFVDFALGTQRKNRVTLRRWGSRLCLSDFAALPSFREPFLQGFILAGGEETQQRYATVRRLFDEGLLTGKYPKAKDALTPASDYGKEDGAALEDELPEVGGLETEGVLLHFYEQPQKHAGHELTGAAVYELFSLALLDLFGAMVGALTGSGRIGLLSLGKTIGQERAASGLWSAPLNTLAGRGSRPRTLVRDIFADEPGGPLATAARGGLLLVKVLYGAPLSEIRGALAGAPLLEDTRQLFAANGDATFEYLFPQLMRLLIERHTVVSHIKDKQRWCYFEGDQVIKDDVQEMGIGFHSLRFPQLHSLCSDLDLTKEELRHDH